MADSGLRRAETINLNWGDVDMQSGLVRVRQGKDKKYRSAVIGATVRRALLTYRRTIERHADNDPLFQARGAVRFTGWGLKRVYRRLSKRTGIHCTPCAGPSLSYPFALEWMYCTSRPCWGMSLLK